MSFVLRHNDFYTDIRIASAVLYYDYCLTLTTEINSVWSKPFSKASALFYANRFVSSASSIYQFLLTLIFRYIPLLGDVVVLYYRYLTHLVQSVALVDLSAVVSSVSHLSHQKKCVPKLLISLIQQFTPPSSRPFRRTCFVAQDKRH